MNYIKQLEESNRDKQARLDSIKEEMNLLITYLNSSKFNCGDSLDQYVNVKDVLNRITEIKSILYY